MGRSQDEAAALVQDIYERPRGVHLVAAKANGIQLRCELVVPQFCLFSVSMYNTHHTLSKEECQGVGCLHLESMSSACGWPIWLKGQSAKERLRPSIAAHVCLARSFHLGHTAH